MSYTPPPPPPPPPGPGMGGPGGYAQPQTNQKAMWSMILGILSPLCCGFFTGIPALVLGNMARKEVQASGGAQTGAGMATAGIVLGIIGTVVSIVYIILYATGVLTIEGSTNATA